MAVPFFLAFFVLSFLIFIQPVPTEEAKNFQGRCLNPFDCNKFGTIGFPLSRSTENSQCGLCRVTCDEYPPKIHLGNESPSYEVQNINQSGKITQVQIHDRRLQHQLQSKSCNAFGHYLRFPNSTSISFTISPTLTLFKCNKISPIIPPTDDHFNGFLNHTDCDDFNIYYKYPDNDQHAAPNCPMIQLPISLNHDPNDLFGLLSATFSVELDVSDDCWDCHLGGVQCPNDNQTFHCKAKKGETNLGLILGIVIPSVTIIIFMICCLIVMSNRRKYFPSFFLLRKTTSDPSREADLECSRIFFGIHVFSYRELQEATNNFDPSKELGDGGFGTVYHGKLQDGREVAVKRLNEHNYKLVKQFMNEIEILTRLRHPNLVTLYGCTSRHSCELLLVYEYIPNGTVADHLHGDRAKDGSVSWPIRMNIAIETASALAYLHATDIIHRDVKTNNILLDNNFCVKVADFGLSRLVPNGVTHVSTTPQGTPGYVDPEYHQCYQLTAKSDVYSFGVVLIELVSSLPAVDINRHRHEINLANVAMNRIQNGAFNELIDTSLGFESDSSVERMTTSVAEVAFRCLQLDKEMRPTMDDVLEALKEIKDYKDETMGKRLPPSPEGDNTLLLKEYKTAMSTDSVTSTRVSSSSISISSG